MSRNNADNIAQPAETRAERIARFTRSVAPLKKPTKPLDGEHFTGGEICRGGVLAEYCQRVRPTLRGDQFIMTNDTAAGGACRDIWTATPGGLKPDAGLNGYEIIPADREVRAYFDYERWYEEDLRDFDDIDGDSLAEAVSDALRVGFGLDSEPRVITLESHGVEPNKTQEGRMMFKISFHFIAPDVWALIGDCKKIAARLQKSCPGFDTQPYGSSGLQLFRVIYASKFGSARVLVPLTGTTVDTRETIISALPPADAVKCKLIEQPAAPPAPIAAPVAKAAAAKGQRTVKTLEEERNRELNLKRLPKLIPHLAPLANDRSEWIEVGLYMEQIGATLDQFIEFSKLETQGKFDAEDAKNHFNNDFPKRTRVANPFGTLVDLLIKKIGRDAWKEIKPLVYGTSEKKAGGGGGGVRESAKKREIRELLEEHGAREWRPKPEALGAIYASTPLFDDIDMYECSPHTLGEICDFLYQVCGYSHAKNTIASKHAGKIDGTKFEFENWSRFLNGRGDLQLWQGEGTPVEYVTLEPFLTVIKPFVKYERVAFVPHFPFKPDRRVLNLFTGFVHEFDPEYEWQSVEILHERLLFELCNCDESIFSHMMDYLAHKIQKPQLKTGIAPGFRSAIQGLGKNTFFEWFGGKILGEKYFRVLTSLDELFEHFNADAETKLLTILDECVWAEAHASNSKLKAAITGGRVRHTRKGVDTEDGRDYQDIILLSNSFKCAKVEAGDRRMFIIDVVAPERTKEEHAAWFTQLYAAAEDPTQAKAFFHKLATRDISKFIPANFPNTAARDELKALAMPAVDQFCKELAGRERDHFDKKVHDSDNDGKDPEPFHFPKAELYDYFKAWLIRTGNDVRMNATSFTREVSKFAGPATKVKARTSVYRDKCCWLLDYAAMRKAIAAAYKAEEGSLFDLSTEPAASSLNDCEDEEEKRE